MTLSKERLRAISQNIRTVRKAYGLTQEEIAEKIGVTPEYYGQLESGNKAPSLETLINIAESMHVSIDLLVYGSNRDLGLGNIIQLLSDKKPETLQKIEKLLYTLNHEFIEK